MIGYSSPARAGLMISQSRPIRLGRGGGAAQLDHAVGGAGHDDTAAPAEPGGQPGLSASRAYSSVEYWTSRVPLSDARSWPTRPAACQVVPQDS